MENNAYKIRFDLLAMARDILREEWNRKCQPNEQEYFQKVEIQRGMQTSIVVPYPEQPVSPTSRDIIRIAGELNDFVSRKQ